MNYFIFKAQIIFYIWKLKHNKCITSGRYQWNYLMTIYEGTFIEINIDNLEVLKVFSQWTNMSSKQFVKQKLKIENWNPTKCSNNQQFCQIETSASLLISIITNERTSAFDFDLSIQILNSIFMELLIGALNTDI